jgi:hypothetical protein
VTDAGGDVRADAIFLDGVEVLAETPPRPVDVDAPRKGAQLLGPFLGGPLAV